MLMFPKGETLPEDSGLLFAVLYDELAVGRIRLFMMRCWFETLLDFVLVMCSMVCVRNR